ncbi:MAG TPA: 3-hydroxyacyl-CoA dehydrogenase NAD-binding domain-containing protein [Stellaceae bacterium]|nr:3-hydroxyacyl-CoA dehydrogenase NAD-binding domain-containing protein [Stellaceae bacterium]
MPEADQVVRSARERAVAILTIDSPPVNALSHAVRSGIKSALDAAIADASVAAVVLICAGRTFVAGADITEFGKPMREPGLAAVIGTIEASTKPVVAAIHGTALGGGLELALACHYRVAVAAARLGLPEVKLGILPGAGGTQRLPRVVGVPLALDMISGGEPIGAAVALQHGLVDEVAAGDLRAAAVGFAEKVVREGLPLRRIRDMSDKLKLPEPDFFRNYRATLGKRKRGLEAPQACIDAVEAAVTLPFDEGLKRERELFLKLLGGEQSKAQRYFFFAERDAAKIPDVPADTPVRPIGKAAVIGAGTMGGGIAMNFANAGIPVTVVEADAAALERGLGVVRKNYEISASRGGMESGEIATRMGLIKGSISYDDIADADIVIEAVFEDMALKKDIFARLDRMAKRDAILATNTSTLDVNTIAAATSRPESVIGLHFFSPANVMRLLEIVRGAKTAKPVIATSMALAKTIRKVPALVGVCDGFVGNRMLAQRGREAERLLIEGALPHQVDKVLTDFGFPMGPFAMGDLAGLDVGWRVRQARGTKAPIADALYEAGRLGQKTGAGYYHYEPGSRAPLPDPEVERIIVGVSEKLGVERRPIAEPEMLERLLYPMINEGAKILDEGIALRPGDIDVIWVYGYGWPVYRGGPMHYADTVGPGRIAERLGAFAQRFGERALAPAPLLQRLAAEARGFADWQAPAKSAG